MVADVKVQGDALSVGVPKLVFPTRLKNVVAGWPYDVTRDGRFLIDTELDDFSPITLLQHWQADNSRNTQAERLSP